MSQNQPTNENKKGCAEGVHPRDKVFTWHFIHNPMLQAIINSGGVVAGCMACKKSYPVKMSEKPSGKKSVKGV